jgi:hypothetical protein
MRLVQWLPAVCAAVGSAASGVRRLAISRRAHRRACRQLDAYARAAHVSRPPGVLRYQTAEMKRSAAKNACGDDLNLASHRQLSIRPRPSRDT